MLNNFALDLLYIQGHLTSQEAFLDASSLAAWPQREGQCLMEVNSTGYLFFPS